MSSKTNMKITLMSLAVIPILTGCLSKFSSQTSQYENAVSASTVDNSNDVTTTTTTTTSSTVSTTSTSTTSTTSTTTSSSTTTTQGPPANDDIITLNWNYENRDELDADPMASASDVYVDGINGPVPREEFVDITEYPWIGEGRVLRVNYDGTGDNTGEIGGEQYGGAVRRIPGVVLDGNGGTNEPRHIWLRTWVYLAPNFDGWGWKMLHLRTLSGTRTEVKPYADSMHPVIDNNSSYQTAYVGRNVAGLDRGRWVEIMVERKFATEGQSDGIFRVRWAGQVVADYVNIAPLRDNEINGGYRPFHQNIAFGLNTGPTQQTYVLWGPAEIWFDDPGWEW